MEAAIIRQETEHCVIKWVRSEQQVADCLTKDMDDNYPRLVFESNLWTLGPDSRAPSSRKRKLIGPEAGPHTDEQQALALNQKFKAIVADAEDVILDEGMDTLLATSGTCSRKTPMHIPTRAALGLLAVCQGMVSAAGSGLVKTGELIVYPSKRYSLDMLLLMITISILIIMFVCGACCGCLFRRPPRRDDDRFVEAAIRGKNAIRRRRQETLSTGVRAGQVGRPSDVGRPRPKAESRDHLHVGEKGTLAEARQMIEPESRDHLHVGEKGTLAGPDNHHQSPSGDVHIHETTREMTEVMPCRPAADETHTCRSTSASSSSGGGRCTLCNAKMVLKRRSTGGWFFGCSEYPLCKGSRRPYYTK